MAGLPSVPTHASANIRPKMPRASVKDGWDKARVWRTMKNAGGVCKPATRKLAHRTKPAKASASASSSETADAVRKRHTDGQEATAHPCQGLQNFSFSLHGWAGRLNFGDDGVPSGRESVAAGEMEGRSRGVPRGTSAESLRARAGLEEKWSKRQLSSSD